MTRAERALVRAGRRLIMADSIGFEDGMSMLHEASEKSGRLTDGRISLGAWDVLNEERERLGLSRLTPVPITAQGVASMSEMFRKGHSEFIAPPPDHHGPTI